MEPFVISKTRPDEIILDFERLRTEGIGHLENMAPWIWTDFNAHDPGITLLEVLCYALTDLGYRTHRIPVADLIAPAPGETEDTFFKAHEILPMEPVTVSDFRKLLIDLPGIRNAWLTKAVQAEIDLFISDTMAFKPLTEGGGFNEKIEAWIEDLIHEDDREAFKEKLRKLPGNEDSVKKLEELRVTSEEFVKRLLCHYRYWPIGTTEEDGYSSLVLNGLYNIILDIDPSIDPNNVKVVKQLKNKVMDILHAHRPLCEDFLEPEIITPQDVCICLDIEMAQESDELEVMAQVVYWLQQYLNPSVPFYSFKQMREQGYSCDEILNGPLLANGFIKDADLEQSELRRHIYKSDLVRLILDNDSVLSVKGLSIKLEGDDVFDSDWWCKEVVEGAKPVLDICCSDFYASKGVLSFKVSENELSEKLEFISFSNENIITETERFPIPHRGVHRPDLDEYLSIQYEFPSNYGVGDNKLPDPVAGTREAQIKQLQAFLLFFDQLLASYLKTLSRVRDILSVNQGSEDDTSFYHALYEVPGIKELLRPFPDEGDWQAFEADDKNGYISALKKIVAPTARQQDRKNRLLNHMLARFGEQFTDYVLTVLKTNIDTSDDPWQQPFNSYLQAKATFLNHLPELGSERGKAYNYRAFSSADNQPDVWNTQNVAGLKKRICLLMGIEDFRTQSLLCEPEYYVDMVQKENKQGMPVYKLNLADRKSGKVLMSGKNIPRRGTAMKLRERVYREIWIEDRLILEQKGSSDTYYLRFKLDGKIVLQSKSLPDEDATYFKKRVERLVTDQQCEKEGFHLLEHILLRPDDKEDHTLELAFGCDPEHGPKDPYSFWLTVVLPSEGKRFQDLNFRKYFEQLFRYQTPAHIAPRFCWLDRNELYRFEPLYKRWMEEKAKCKPDACNVSRYANALIAFLNTVTCDCECSGQTEVSNCGSKTGNEEVTTTNNGEKYENNGKTYQKG